jgi:tRNA 2-thiouridine synthesizing protein A
MCDEGRKNATHREERRHIRLLGGGAAWSTPTMSTRILDVRGRACPAPIVELMRAIRGLVDGERVEVIADDRAFPADVAAWCRKTNNALLSLETRADAHVAVIRKGQVYPC